jgi:hypothetical protein
MFVAYSERPTIHHEKLRPARKKLDLSLRVPTLRAIYQSKNILPATAENPTVQSSQVNLNPIVVPFRFRASGPAQRAQQASYRGAMIGNWVIRRMV